MQSDEPLEAKVAVDKLASLIDQLPDTDVVTAVTYRGRRVWIKRAQGRSMGWSSVRAALFIFVARYLGRGLPLSAPIDEAKVCLEAARLRHYDQLGLKVPKVLYARQSHFIIEDAGKGLREELDVAVTDPDRAQILDEALDSLIEWHQRQQWHGGAQLRNLTRREGEVFRIDFEEPYAGRVALPLLQVLDLCLQLSSTDRYSTPPHRKAMGRRWFWRVGSQPIGLALRRVLGLLYMLASFPLLRLARYEHRRVRAAIEALEGAVEEGESRGLDCRPYRRAMPIHWRAVAVGIALMLAADDVLEFALEYDDRVEEVEGIRPMDGRVEEGEMRLPRGELEV